METFFFGSNDSQLLGAYWPPATFAGSSRSLLICNPLGHEYLRSHRFLNLLATQFAGQGFHVMRFDYLGSGDSAGLEQDVTWQSCQADLELAISEFSEVTGNDSHILLGLRFGANLILGCPHARDGDSVILWDAIDDGNHYVNQIQRLHKEMLKDTQRFSRPVRQTPSPVPNLLGTDYSPEFLAELKSMPVSPELPPGSRVLTVAASSPENRDGTDYLQCDDYHWGSLAAIEIALSPGTTWKQACAWLNHE